MVAFDTETTGQYPLTAEICEVAAVKWQNGQVIDRYQTLIRPSHEIPEEVIKIHGITNSMVASAPLIGEVLPDFLKFIEGSVLVAHHAAFDLGFLALEIEKFQELPVQPVICSSLLSRKVIPESPNHRLQTLIRHLGIEQGQAHRALDDSKACLEVALECFKRVGERANFSEMVESQGKRLDWHRFSMEELLEIENFSYLVKAARERGRVRFKYSGGSKKGQAREVAAMGLVRSLDGDYFVGFCQNEGKKKRYYLNKIQSVELLP